MKQYYIYFLTNKTHDILYIGVTNDLQRRNFEHKQKLIDGFSKTYNVTKLVYYEVYDDINLAIAREKQLKKWRREKKDMLVNQMNPQWKELTEF